MSGGNDPVRVRICGMGGARGGVSRGMTGVFPSLLSTNARAEASFTDAGVHSSPDALVLHHLRVCTHRKRQDALKQNQGASQGRSLL